MKSLLTSSREVARQGVPIVTPYCAPSVEKVRKMGLPMKCWQGEQLRVISSASTAQEAFDSVLAEANRIGFSYCSFGMKGPVPLAAPRVVWCSNYPVEWQRRYEEQGYMRVDPTVQGAIVSDEIMVWSEELYASAPELLADAAAHGLRYGVAVPRRDARGMVSLLSFVRSESPVTAEELLAKRERMHWLSVLCHDGMLKVWGDLLRDDSAVDLSQRECDVLRWACEGKTSTDIAQIMQISEATVNFHTRNSCAKLGTSNRTAAAVRAALLGLLW